jgi:ribonuclease VapC
MVIDSSALLAIVFAEPDASIYASAILNSTDRMLSAVSFVEASMVAMRYRAPDPVALLDNLIEQFEILIVPVSHEQALLARDAFRRFGKGRHKAGLNFGDCFSYALAKQTGEPLLYKGNDFSKTDILSARLMAESATSSEDQ